jgi:desulfoferrodoxin (superoxide reductase-like protein)
LQANLEAIVTPTTEKDNDSTTDETTTIHIPVIEMTNKLIAEYLPVKILVEDLSKPGASCGRTCDVIFLWNFIFF